MSQQPGKKNEMRLSPREDHEREMDVSTVGRVSNGDLVRQGELGESGCLNEDSSLQLEGRLLSCSVVAQIT